MPALPWDRAEARPFAATSLSGALPCPSLLPSLPEGFLLEHFLIKPLAEESLAQALLLGNELRPRPTELLTRLNENMHTACLHQSLAPGKFPYYGCSA